MLIKFATGTISIPLHDIGDVSEYANRYAVFAFPPLLELEVTVTSIDRFLRSSEIVGTPGLPYGVTSIEALSTDIEP